MLLVVLFSTLLRVCLPYLIYYYYCLCTHCTTKYVAARLRPGGAQAAIEPRMCTGLADIERTHLSVHIVFAIVFDVKRKRNTLV